MGNLYKIAALNGVKLHFPVEYKIDVILSKCKQFDLFVGIIFTVSTIRWAVKFVIMAPEKIELLRCYKA